MKLSSGSWISSINLKKLQLVGIFTTEDLLRAGSNAKKRAILAKTVGVTQRTVLRWIHSADLMRVQGVSADYVTILTHAKIYTPEQLAKQEVDHLSTQFAEVNSTYRLVRRLPGSNAISGWIDSAQSLPHVINYE